MHRVAREIALALALLAVAFAASHFTRQRQLETQLGSDEPEWIAISILHWRQLVHGEPPAGAQIETGRERSANAWKQGVQDTTFGYMNPCLPKLVWGATLHARGFDAASPLAFDVFSRDDVAARQRARAELLPAAATARAVVVFFAALCAVLLVLIARAVWPGWRGALAGGAAFVLWFASPLVQSTSSYLRTDYFMLPFCLGALLLALRAREALAGAHGTAAQVRVALALGLLCGLAVSSKLNGTLACFAVGAWTLWLWSRAPSRTRPSFARGPLLALALAAATSIAVFIALNPSLWSGPVDGVRDVLARWDKLMTYFTDKWGPAQGFEVPHSTWERVELFARKTFARDDALGARLQPLVGALVCVAGFVLLVRRWRDSRAAILLVFTLVLIAGTALWLPLDWERFYLTATPCIVLLESAAIAECARLIARRDDVSA